MNNSPQIFKSVADFQHWRKKIGTSSRQNTVGFVPTMGALHQGHAELLKKSMHENDFTILSIYVNPTQFNNPEDLKKYPVNLEADVAIAQSCGVQAVLCPTYEQVYPDFYRYKVSENAFSKNLCGAHRPGHFDGVLTVVMKLLNITLPDHAYFGEKDYQQLRLIEDMVKSFFIPVKIVAVPTLREESGLAMSSRNTRLSVEGRKKAALIYQLLQQEKDVEIVKEQLSASGFTVEYVEDVNDRRFVAATLEGVRLIDNVSLK